MALPTGSKRIISLVMMADGKIGVMTERDLTKFTHDQVANMERALQTWFRTAYPPVRTTDALRSDITRRAP